MIKVSDLVGQPGAAPSAVIIHSCGTRHQSRGSPVRVATASPQERLAAHWRLHEALVHASLDERERVVDALRSWAGGGAPRVRPLMADGVRQLAALPGVTIGAHTVNHLALPDQSDGQLVELMECQADLKRVTGQPIDLFAYPYGAVDRECASSVRRCGVGDCRATTGCLAIRSTRPASPGST